MKRLVARYSFLLFLFMTLSLNAQSNKKPKYLTHVEFNENVNDPLTSDEIKKIKEVYGDDMQKYVLDIPIRLKSIKHILRNRVKIELVENKDLTSLPSLSQVPILDPNNLGLKRDAFFNPKTFNPLKYDFNFFSRQETRTYRAYNSNYIITVFSQHTKID